MGRDSRAVRRLRSVDDRPVTKVRTPADIVTLIPYLLGFEPRESVVVIGLEQPRLRFGPCFRVDLADTDAPAMVAYLDAMVEHLKLSRVIVVAFTEHAARADAVLTALPDRLRSRGVGVQECLRADGRRWWSPQCSLPCCPPGGTPYEAASSRVAAEAVVAGMSRASSRDDLRLHFAPDGPGRDQVAVALDGMSDATAEAAEEVLARGLSTPHRLTGDDHATLLRWVQPIRQRDEVWQSIDRATASTHLELWAAVTRVAPDPVLAPAGSLAGFSAWLGGNGALASVAVDRVLEVCPTYSMARLLSDMLDRAVPPYRWDTRGLP